jgi:hypothetical protein
MSSAWVCLVRSSHPGKRTTAAELAAIPGWGSGGSETLRGAVNLGVLVVSVDSWATWTPILGEGCAHLILAS